MTQRPEPTHPAPFAGTVPPASRLKAPEDLLKFLHLAGMASVVVFGIVFFLLGLRIPAAIEGVYALFTAGTLTWLHLLGGRPGPVVWVQVSMVLLVAAAISLVLGGIYSSGGFMVWGMISPAAALIFLGRRPAAIITVLFALALVVVAGLEPYLTPVNTLPEWLRGPFSAANILGSFCLVMVTLIYFFWRLRGEQEQRDRATQTARRLDGALVAVSRHGSVARRDLPGALRGMLEVVVDELEVARADVWRFEADRRHLRCLQSAGNAEGSPAAGEIVDAASYPVYSRALQGERVVVVDDARTDPRTHELAGDYLAPLSIGALLGAPIWLGGTQAGALYLGHRGSHRRWTREEVNFAASVADLVAQAFEIHEHDRAESARASLEDRLQHTQKLESLGMLAGGIAHDFNNLLVGILGRADLAATALSDDSETGPRRVGEHLEAIAVAGHRAADLCGQLLAYSGRGHFVVEPMDLNEVVREVASLLQVSVSKRASVDYRFGTALPWLEGDPTQVRQVAMNLVTNASEALESGIGSITVATGRIHCTVEQLAAMDHAEGPPGDYVYLQVTDSGHGMDAETRARLFDPFFSTRFTGRGLGMATVLGIVRGHKGAIEVSSSAGRGNTLRVLFPARDWVPGDEPEDTVDNPATDRRGSVLLVDDEAVVRETVGAMLEGAGYDVVTAADGEEGLERFLNDPTEFACVVLDLTMPRMGGREVLEAIRQRSSDTPVVLSSGFSEQEFHTRFGEVQGVRFVQKPFRGATLIEAIDALCATDDS